MLKLLDRLTFNNPWRELERLNEDLNHFMTGEGRSRVPVNVYTSDDKVKVVVALPGWEPEWFSLSLEGDQLYLRGKNETKDEPFLNLDRTINLPYRVEADEVEASYRHGMLSVELHRCELDKPKKIKVKIA